MQPSDALRDAQPFLSLSPFHAPSPCLRDRRKPREIRMHGGCEALGNRRRRRRTQQLLPCKRKIKRPTPLVGHLGTLLLFLSISVPILGQCDGMQGQIMTLAFSHSSGVPGKSTQRQTLRTRSLWLQRTARIQVSQELQEQKVTLAESQLFSRLRSRSRSRSRSLLTAHFFQR